MTALTVSDLRDILDGLPGDMRIILGVEHADMGIPAFGCLKQTIDRRILGSHDVLLKGDNFKTEAESA